MRTAKLAVVLCVAMTACEEEGVRAYHAPKPPAKAAPAPAERRVVWTTPQGWDSVPGDQSVRLATMRTGPDTPEVTITAFPGDAGGLLANINRWRTQLELEPLDQTRLAGTVEQTKIDGVEVVLTQIAGGGSKSGQKMLGAVITPGDGKTWFVKATGPEAGATKLNPVFDAFARSFRLQAAPVAPPPVTTAPAGPSGPAAPAQSADVRARLAAWTPPANWKPDPAASPMVSAAYDATNAEGIAKITVTVLLNSGGGPLANINRWRDQVGLPPVASVEQQPTTDLGGGNFLVDLTAADASRRMIIAVVTQEGGGTQTWFFKATGSPKALDAERASYDQLVSAVGLGRPAGKNP